MKNSNWFIIVPALLLTINLYWIIEELYPLGLLPEHEYFNYFIILLSVLPAFFGSAILVYYKQKRTLIYLYMLSVLMTLVVRVLVDFVLYDPEKPDSYKVVQTLYMVVGAIHLVVYISQVILASRLTHPRIRFWFRFIHIWGLAYLFISIAVPYVVMQFFPRTNIPYNVLGMMGSAIYLVFYLELPKIKTTEEEEYEDRNPDDLLSRKDYQ